MAEYYKKGHFNNLRKKLKNEFFPAFSKETSPSQIRRLSDLFFLKERAIKQSAAIYSEIRKMKDEGLEFSEDYSLETLNKSLDEILDASNPRVIKRIRNLRDMKLWVFMRKWRG
jgi:hypothetical protein|tara:strand:- start:176 stop:517 length:342 start_codon:yes stop_codon:yes gene_type:complete